MHITILDILMPAENCTGVVIINKKCLFSYVSKEHLSQISALTTPSNFNLTNSTLCNGWKVNGRGRCGKMWLQPTRRLFFGVSFSALSESPLHWRGVMLGCGDTQWDLCRGPSSPCHCGGFCYDFYHCHSQTVAEGTYQEMEAPVPAITKTAHRRLHFANLEQKFIVRKQIIWHQKQEAFCAGDIILWHLTLISHLTFDIR